MDLGLLLNLPLESVAVRVVVASAVGVVLLRVLLRVGGLRSVSARIAVALAPAAALVTVVALSTRGDLQLPVLMVPADAIDALAIPISDGYLHFAPVASFLVATWAVIAAVRLGRRAVAHGRAARTARAAGTTAAPPSVTALVARLAGELRVEPPQVVVADACPGGAYVVGTRRTVLVLDRDLLAALDGEELEGVLAHELAHVRRRDNLVSTALGVVRDAAFFVPGGGWALRVLHRERERAADQAAVELTGRPGALASGLLKTLEGPAPAPSCAALAPSADLVARVTDLVDGPPAVSRSRRVTELSAVAGTTVLAVVVAVALPSTLAGPERQRDAVAVVWSAGGAANTAAVAAPAAEARVFDVYRATSLGIDGPSPSTAARIDESSLENRPSTWRACADPEACPDRADGPGLGIVPRPAITLDDDLPWQATPAFPTTGDGTGLPQLFWLQRVGPTDGDGLP